MEQSFVSAVIYASNDGQSVADFLTRIDRELAASFKTYEIIVVNDASLDNTLDEIRRFRSLNTKSLSVINMSYSHGVELCLMAGMDMAIGDYVYEFESVNCDWTEGDLLQAYRYVIDGNDVVFACPKGFKRYIPLPYRVYNFFSRNKNVIGYCRYSLITRRGINRVKSLTMSVPFRKALYNNCGLNAYTYVYQPTKALQPYSMRESYAILIIFTDVAYKFALTLSMLMLAFTVLTLIYALVVYLLGQPTEGWTTTVIFASVSFLGIFLILSVVVRYLSILTGLVFRKQNYVYESVEKIS